MTFLAFERRYERSRRALEACWRVGALAYILDEEADLEIAVCDPHNGSNCHYVLMTGDFDLYRNLIGHFKTIGGLNIGGQTSIIAWCQLANGVYLRFRVPNVDHHRHLWQKLKALDRELRERE